MIRISLGVSLNENVLSELKIIFLKQTKITKSHQSITRKMKLFYKSSLRYAVAVYWLMKQFTIKTNL